MAVTAMIQSHLPEAYLKEDIGGELVYVLPPFSTKVSGAYLSLLRALDYGLSDLSIGCYGISDTTVEEVRLDVSFFLKVDITCCSLRINMCSFLFKQYFKICISQNLKNLKIISIHFL